MRCCFILETPTAIFSGAYVNIMESLNMNICNVSDVTVKNVSTFIDNKCDVRTIHFFAIADY